jgi:anti-sigma regulatory factor (Ser/Thr protein kinase)
MGITHIVMERESWLPALPEGASQARAIVREFAAELRLDGESTWELLLATSETFSNAVEHGSPCKAQGILLRLEGDRNRVRVEVRDCGGSFSGGVRTAKPNGLGGRGIPLIMAVTDELEVLPGADATVVRFEKRVAA